MRKAAVRHPFAASTAVVILFIVSMLIGSFFLTFAPRFFLSNGDLISQFVVEAVICLAGVIFMAIFGYAGTFERTEKFGTGVACSGFFIVMYLLSFFMEIYNQIIERGSSFFSDMLPLWRIVFWPLTVFLIGFGEECFFRGIVANLFWDKHAKDPAGIRTAALYSGIVFGMVHFSNLLGSEPGGVFVQVAGTAAMGTAIAAIYYRSGRNIWVTILLHAFMDGCATVSLGLFGGTISDEISGYSIVTAISSTVPYYIVAAVLLRKKKCAQMLLDDSSIGYIPQASQPEQLVISYDFPSTSESKRSHRRAILVTVIFLVVCLAGHILCTPGYIENFRSIAGLYTLEYNDSGEFRPISETGGVEGHAVMFDIEKSGTYEVTVVAEPSDSSIDMVLRIQRDGAIWYEESFGGKCDTSFVFSLDAGEYELALVYSYAGAKEPAGYNTMVRIR